jgi:hypothetical protein
VDLVWPLSVTGCAPAAPPSLIVPRVNVAAVPPAVAVAVHMKAPRPVHLIIVLVVWSTVNVSVVVAGWVPVPSISVFAVVLCTVQGVTVVSEHELKLIVVLPRPSPAVFVVVADIVLLGRSTVLKFADVHLTVPKPKSSVSVPVPLPLKTSLAVPLTVTVADAIADVAATDSAASARASSSANLLRVLIVPPSTWCAAPFEPGPADDLRLPQSRLRSRA